MVNFFKGIIFTAIGMMIGGPIGGIIGLFIALKSIGKSKFRYSFKCPSCNADNGVDSYGQYSCYNCSENLDISANGVKLCRIALNCPNCGEEISVDGDGVWICKFCNKKMEYINNCIYGYNETFIYSFLAILAKMAKANGHITQEHIKIVDNILLENLKLNKDERKAAIDNFNEAKNDNISFQDYCLRCKAAANRNQIENTYGLFYSIIMYLYILASVSEKISYTANEYLNCAVGILGIKSDDYNNIKCEFGNQVDTKYYKVLGCKDGDSLENIKARYRKLVKEYHPDKVNNMNVSDEIKEVLIEKFKDIQEAYEKIKNSME